MANNEVEGNNLIRQAVSRAAFEAKVIGVFLREVFVYPNMYSDMRVDGKNRQIKVRRFDLNRISKD